MFSTIIHALFWAPVMTLLTAIAVATLHAFGTNEDDNFKH